MSFFLQRSELRDIYDKVGGGERISDADALRLFESKDLNAVGGIADFANARTNGRRASYILNRYINYSNYCILSCQFCSFARKKRDQDGFELTVDEIVQKAREALSLFVKPSRAELLAEMDRIRAMSPYSDVDSTLLIREDRDNDEPYR